MSASIAIQVLPKVETDAEVVRTPAWRFPPDPNTVPTAIF